MALRKPLNPRCKLHPGRKFVKGCKCKSCLACVAENKLNKQLRDKQVADFRKMMQKADHPLYRKPADPRAPVGQVIEVKPQGYDPASPINIFNHPPFPEMTLRQVRDLEDSWP